ncbi:MAG: rod shape-determining protein MreC [bacterium]|nr:rod shape-determining protein MreC [bacterium]
MQSFQRFDRSTSLFIVLLVVAFMLATFDVRSDGTGVGTTMRDGAQTLFSPLQEAASAVTRPVVGFIDALSDIASLREENDELREENDSLRAEVEEFAGVQAELELLRELNGVEVPDDLPTVVARITSPGSSSFDLDRWINKGSDDGISIGDAVIVEQGLVGRIDQVFDGSARVRLILDPNVRVAVRDAVTDQAGFVTGNNTDPLVLRIFQAEEAAIAGTIVETAGSRFPSGIVVGTVIETAADEAGFGLVAEVEPGVSFSSLDFVIVIVGYSPLDAQPQDDLLEQDPVESEEQPTDTTEPGAETTEPSSETATTEGSP